LYFECELADARVGGWWKETCGNRDIMDFVRLYEEFFPQSRNEGYDFGSESVLMETYEQSLARLSVMTEEERTDWLAELQKKDQEKERETQKKLHEYYCDMEKLWLEWCVCVWGRDMG